MSTSAWVCFECRISVRRETQFKGEVPCPECGSACTFLGYKIPVPPKSKIKTWAQLRNQLHREATTRVNDAVQARVQRQHQLEQEISKLQTMPSNPGRSAAIRRLQKKLGGAGA